MSYNFTLEASINLKLGLMISVALGDWYPCHPLLPIMTIVDY